MPAARLNEPHARNGSRGKFDELAQSAQDPKEHEMYESKDDHGLENLDLSDDDLDFVAGGLPHDDRDPSFESMVNDRPRTNDPGLWF
jgi:hypothetical protein